MMAGKLTSTAERRIQKDIKELQKKDDGDDSKCGISVEIVNDNMKLLKATIQGPPDTPYEGGKYILDIAVPESYPMKPPKVQFVTKIWHPNISSVTGAVCLDILKENWLASMSLRTVLLSLQVLLTDPVPDSPQDAVVATQYKQDPSKFWEKARNWAQTYAEAPKSISK